MKKIITTLTFAVAIMLGTTAMAQHHHHDGKECCQQNTNNTELKCQDKPCCKEGQKEAAVEHQCCAQEKCKDHQHPHHAQNACCKEGEMHNHHNGHAHEFRPNGKVIVNLFEHFGATSTSTGWNQNGFQMERAYFGYKYQFSPEWSTTVILDAQQGNGLNIEHVFLKNAFVQYSSKGLTVSAGVIPTVQGTMAENCWGYRYVARSMYDLYGYGNTADLGIFVKYDINDILSADLSMLNGEGFRKIQLNDHYLYGAGITFSPYKGFNLRVYGDIQTTDTNAVLNSTLSGADTSYTPSARKNLQVHAGYDNKYFRVGAEYNWQFCSDFTKGHLATGLSVYATGKVTPRLNIFARYDRGVSKDNSLLATAWNYNQNGQNMFFGVDYRINKMVAIAPAVQYHIDPANNTTLYAYLSGKISF